MKSKYLTHIVNLALKEDIGQGDITTNNLFTDQDMAQAHLVYKSRGIVCGLDVAQCVFKTMSPKIHVKRLVKEGARVKKGTVVAVIKGPAKRMLTAERVAINFLTHLSAIATHTKAFVDQIKPYRSKIYDTRKTTPLLRELERYAVRTGGGYNHRFDLSTMAMIKDNHRAMFGNIGLKKAVEMIKSKTKRKVVLEIDTLKELKEALSTSAEIILLDNMTPSQIRKAVVLRDKLKSKALLEASGGINLKTVRSYARTGVERISVGSLTSIKQAIDISLDFVL